MGQHANSFEDFINVIFNHKKVEISPETEKIVTI